MAKAQQLISERAGMQPQQHLSKPQTCILFDPEIALLRSDPAGVSAHVQSDTHTGLLIIASFVIAKG